MLYAGNIGEGQGLEVIIPKLAESLNDKVKFRIIGDGGKRKKLERALQKLSLNNIELIAPMAQDRLIEEYQQGGTFFFYI